MEDIDMMRAKDVIIGILLTACLLSAGCSHDNPDLPIVGLYSDRGADEECLQATRSMLEWMGYAVESIEAPSVNTGALGEYDALCFPGGNMYHYAEDISPAGKENIRDFIGSGGGYLGICGGAYFAGEVVVWLGDELDMTPLGLFEGRAVGPIKAIAPYPEYTMCQVNITDAEHQVTQSQPDSLWVLYYWGPALLPDADADVTVLGRYDIGGQPTMLAFDCGLGRVFLVGAHPEIEVDCDRDGVTLADELDDQGSDWDLLAQAVQWCLKE